jgi:hypothetical protein
MQVHQAAASGMPASNFSVTYAHVCRRMLTYAFENRLVHDLAAASGMPASNLSVADVCAVASGAGDARMLEVRTATYADVCDVCCK